jgi:hypothetical protein
MHGDGMQQLRPNKILGKTRTFIPQEVRNKVLFLVGPKQGKRSPQAPSQELNHF